MDFRLDHLAMCSLGITLAVALLTGRFRSAGWSVVFGAAAAVTLCTRYLTGPYFVLIFGALAAWTAVAPDRRRRFRNLGLAALAAFILSAPLLWLNRVEVYNYYWIGHFFGPGKRHSGFASQSGPINRLCRPSTSGGETISARAFGRLAAAISLVLAAFAVARRRRPPEPGFPPATGWPLEAVALGGIFLLAPGFVLTLHGEKSPAVDGIMAPGAVVALLGAWAALLDFIRPRLSPAASGRLTGSMAAVALLWGGVGIMSAGRCRTAAFSSELCHRRGPR